MSRRDLTFSDSDCEIRVAEGAATVHDRARDRYYRVPTGTLPDGVRAALRPSASRIPVGVSAAATGAVMLGWLVLVLTTSAPFALNASAVVTTATVLAGSIVLHELAHVVALRCFGRSIDRIGLKLNHGIFPAVYVRMTQSVLLARSEQVIVHLAGIGANVVTLTVLASANVALGADEAITAAVHLTVVLLGWNFVPLLGSDGYRILLAFSGTEAARNWRHDPSWLKFLRLVGLAAAIVALVRLLISLTGALHV